MNFNSTIQKIICDIFHSFPGNTVFLEQGKRHLTIYDEPLIGFAAADDLIFDTFKQHEVIGEVFMKPTEWLPDAKSVISMFLPFTEDVRRSNADCGIDPSEEWLYARVEGQDFIARFTDAVGDALKQIGINSCIPTNDSRFSTVSSALDGDTHIISTWSERHAAYACGLGTFGITRGIITHKGTAGRFCSIIINKAAEPDVRPYSGVYDYCIRCGACVAKCPVNAISLEYGKKNSLCGPWVDSTRERFAPRYGCGKCQLGVPCESGIPLKSNNVG